MSEATVSPSKSNQVRLPDRPCPACGTPSPAMLATLPSGRRAVVEACAICGRQEVSAIPSNQKGAMTHE